MGKETRPHLNGQETAPSAERLALALGGKRSGNRGWLACCPAHDDRRPSLSISEGDDSRVLLHCWAGCGFDEIRHELRARGLWPEGSDEQPDLDPGERWRRKVEREAREVAEREAKAIEALAIWHAARPIWPGDLADRYLTNRLGPWPGPWPASLRFGAYQGSGWFNRYPSLISAITRWPSRTPHAVQETPLKEPGVKRMHKPGAQRFTTGKLHGGVVRLSPWHPGDRIFITEGVEDGLALLAAMAPDRVTVWAALGAGNAADIVLPEGADVTLALDADEPGRLGTRKAVAAMWARGHRVRVANLPDGLDPLDVMQGGPDLAEKEPRHE